MNEFAHLDPCFIPPPPAEDPKSLPGKEESSPAEKEQSQQQQQQPQEKEQQQQQQVEEQKKMEENAAGAGTPPPYIHPNCVLKLVPTMYTQESARQHLVHFQEVMDRWQTPSESVYCNEILKSKDEDEAAVEENEYQGGALNPKSYQIDGIQSDPLSLFYRDPKENLSLPGIRSLSLSGWNPPTRQRVMLGDFYYLEVTTMENKSHVITASSSGFFGNLSNLKRFNHSPDQRWPVCHTLADLLKLMSPSFHSGLTERLTKMRSSVHPFELSKIPFSFEFVGCSS